MQTSNFSEIVTARYVKLTALDNFFVAPGNVDPDRGGTVLVLERFLSAQSPSLPHHCFVVLAGLPLPFVAANSLAPVPSIFSNPTWFNRVGFFVSSELGL